MNSEQTPREAIAKAMFQALQHVDSEADELHWQHWKDEHLKDADAVIAHLWQRAESPEVVEAAAAALYGRGHDPASYFPYEIQPLEVREHYENLATLTLSAGLTALLGPKPEDSHER